MRKSKRSRSRSREKHRSRKHKKKKDRKPDGEEEKPLTEEEKVNKRARAKISSLMQVERSSDPPSCEKWNRFRYRYLTVRTG